MSKMIIDFPPPRFRPQKMANSASPQSITGVQPTWKSNRRSGGLKMRFTSCATMVTCLLMQVLSLASSASGEEEFSLIPPETPICENCVQNNGLPVVDHNLGQVAGQVESKYLIEAPASYGSTIFEPGNVVQSDLSYVDYGQSFDYGQGFQHNQGFNSGVELVSYDSQAPVRNYGGAASAVASASVYRETQVRRFPSAQTYQPSTVSPGNVQPGLAQRKAVQAAQSGVRGHLGGGLGGAKYEGVGWSNHSAQNAISSCCYWGVRPTAQIGVSKGKDGFWYACVLYH